MSKQQTNRFELRANQKANLEILRKNFGLSDSELERCLYFRQKQDEPWIPPDITIAIARHIPSIRHIASAYEKFVPELQQVVFSAIVTDIHERSFQRIGIATVGEQPNGLEIEAATLAEGRALNAVLNAAGVNPFKAGAAFKLELPAPPTEMERKYFHVTDQAESRTKDLRQIHAAAEHAGLIVGKDLRRYRNWLDETFGTRTAATLSAEERAQVINKLNLLDIEGEFMGSLPDHLHEDALIA